VAACCKCNHKKSNKLLSECGKDFKAVTLKKLGPPNLMVNPFQRGHARICGKHACTCRATLAMMCDELTTTRHRCVCALL